MGPESAEPIRATLSFVVDTGEMPINYPSEAGGREERDVGEENHQEVLIRNARLETQACKVDPHGFELIEQKDPKLDFYDDEIVETIYKPSVEEMLRQHLGARRVFVFDYTRRTDDVDLRDARKIRGPAALVHNDYTSKSGLKRLEDFLPEEAARTDHRRIQIINVWRSINGPVERSPLAMCDARTVEPQNLIVTERRARDRIGQISRFTYNPDYEWFYFPRLSPDEALLIRTFDSASNDPMRVAPHCAFDVPGTLDSAAPRCSLEVRAFVLH
jgi:hypothetical protein